MAVNISNVHSVSGVVNLFCFKFLKFFPMLHEGIDLREFGSGRGLRRRNPHPWLQIFWLLLIPYFYLIYFNLYTNYVANGLRRVLHDLWAIIQGSGLLQDSNILL